MSEKKQGVIGFLKSIGISSKVAIKCLQIGITLGVIIGIIYFVHNA